MGESPAMIAKHMEEPSEESTLGTVIGDETRLRQIVTNLARCANFCFVSCLARTDPSEATP